MLYELKLGYSISINPIENGKVEYWVIKEKESGGCILDRKTAKDSFEAKKKAKEWLKKHLKEKEK